MTDNSETEGNPYESPRMPRAMAKERGTRTWMRGFLLFAPFLTLVICAVCAYLSIAVGLFDRMGPFWGGTLYIAVGLIGLGALLVGAACSVVSFVTSTGGVRVLPFVTGSINMGVFIIVRWPFGSLQWLYLLLTGDR